MKLDFAPSESPWNYRLFLIFSVAFFVVPAWLGPFGAILADAFNRASLSNWPSSWVRLDPWVVEPQVRLLLFTSPPLAERWPISGGLADAHRIMYSVFYGVLAWICVRLVHHQFSVWWLRLWWLFIYWAVCLGFFLLVAMMMVKFGVLPQT